MTPGQVPAPVTVRLGERGRNPNGSFQVRVSFGEAAEYDATVTDPADQRDEAQLAWYFEKHLRFPFLDEDLRRQAVQQITDYGQMLFSQVFGGAANHDYRRLRDRAFDGCRIEVSGSAGFHRLHWEACGTRTGRRRWRCGCRSPARVERWRRSSSYPRSEPTLNILVVAARPFGPEDMGYRTISRPLLDVCGRRACRSPSTSCGRAHGRRCALTCGR